MNGNPWRAWVSDLDTKGASEFHRFLNQAVIVWILVMLSVSSACVAWLAGPRSQDWGILVSLPCITLFLGGLGYGIILMARTVLSSDNCYAGDYWIGLIMVLVGVGFIGLALAFNVMGWLGMDI